MNVPVINTSKKGDFRTNENKTNQLAETLIFELTKAMALPQTEKVRALIRLIFGRATQRFSELVLGFDHEIEQYGSAAGARWLLPNFVMGHEAHGAEIIPNDGCTGYLLIHQKV